MFFSAAVLLTDPRGKQSFSKLVMVYTFSSQIGQPPSTGERRLDKLASLRLQMDDELQSRCAGFVEAEIERHSARVSDKKVETNRDNGSGSDTADSDEEQATNTKGKETARTKKAIDSQEGALAIHSALFSGLKRAASQQMTSLVICKVLLRTMHSTMFWLPLCDRSP